MWDRYNSSEVDAMEDIANFSIEGSEMGRFILTTSVTRTGCIEVSTYWDETECIVATLEDLYEVEQFIEGINATIGQGDDDQAERFVKVAIANELDRRVKAFAPKSAASVNR